MSRRKCRWKMRINRNRIQRSICGSRARSTGRAGDDNRCDQRAIVDGGMNTVAMVEPNPAVRRGMRVRVKS